MQTYANTLETGTLLELEPVKSTMTIGYQRLDVSWSLDVWRQKWGKDQRSSLLKNGGRCTGKLTIHFYELVQFSHGQNS